MGVVRSRTGCPDSRCGVDPPPNTAPKGSCTHAGPPPGPACGRFGVCRGFGLAPPQSVNSHSVQRNIATPDPVLLLEQWLSGTGEASQPVAVAVDRLLDLRKLVGTRREALVDVVLAELTAMHSVPAGWWQAQLERLRSELSAAVVDTPKPPCEDLAHVSSFSSDAPASGRTRAGRWRRRRAPCARRQPRSAR